MKTAQGNLRKQFFTRARCQSLWFPMIWVHAFHGRAAACCFPPCERSSIWALIALLLSPPPAPVCLGLGPAARHCPPELHSTECFYKRASKPAQPPPITRLPVYGPLQGLGHVPCPAPSPLSCYCGCLCMPSSGPGGSVSFR